MAGARPDECGDDHVARGLDQREQAEKDDDQSAAKAPELQSHRPPTSPRYAEWAGEASERRGSARGFWQSGLGGGASVSGPVAAVGAVAIGPVAAQGRAGLRQEVG